MRRSIRWTLIGWYGLLLVAVLATFGATLYLQSTAATLDIVDAGLRDRVNAIAGAMEWDEQDGWEIELSDDYLRGITADAYFGVWDADGALLLQGGSGGPDLSAHAPGTHTRGERREMRIAGPQGTSVLVGRSIREERARLATLLAVVVGAGVAVLALGLCGGWWLARRTLAPVAALTEAVAAIGPRDLATRLDEGCGPEELHGLARAFNATLARLEAAFERQARFTADASHELRTPLAVMRAQAELALKGERAPAEQRATIEACLRATERMSGLVEGLLALARADSGEHRPAREEVALDELVRETTEFLRPAAEAEQVALRCTTTPVTVRGDPRLLADVVRNLVDNGVRYNRRGGEVQVDLACENGHAVLRVSDTGIGIPEEAQARLFERFYRADPARSRRHGGSGLGLAIAHGIVQAEGGSIGVESRPGAGSTFTVKLPSAGA
jgi:two-component system OmpR family sensor kinase